MGKHLVYFIAVKNNDDVAMIQRKFRQLIAETKLFDFVQPGQKAVVKLHFGEEGNTGHVRPEYIRVIADALDEKKATTIAADTNTLYRGMRTNSKDHLKIASQHGFTKEKTGAEIIIPEDEPQNITEVVINQQFIKTAKVSRMFLEADALINVAHFKGHLMTGFGGALKNIGMGCATRAGKLAQHAGVSPIVYQQNCVGCGACEAVCPADAITIVDEKAVIDNVKCIGCASCIAACQYSAIDVNWEAGSGHIQDKMIEYAKAVLDSRQGKAVHINFAVKITKECDCLAKDDPRVCPDIGIFASIDPVAVDKACYDMVVKECKRDIFKELHPNRDGLRQLNYAQQLGLGELEYELITLKS